MKQKASTLLSTVALFGLMGAPVATAGVVQPAALAPTSKVALEGPPVFPLEDVQRGLKGVGYTVFESALGPEAFEFEVLGVMRGYLGPGEDLIIAELKGEKIERTGVISGMSGSPVYVDGKLVGAVGYRFGTFTDKPIAGITPIERMLAVSSPYQGLKASPASGPPQRLAATAWGAAEPIAVPLAMTGMSPRVVAAFQEELSARGYGPIVPGASSTSSAAQGAAAPPERLYAGGPVAGLLVDGDVLMAGIGTVTWVSGERFLAFGHPFLGMGSSTMPVSNAYIVTTVASRVGSWKMGQATTPVGALTDDRLHAIAGDIGRAPKTVAVDALLRLAGPRAASDAREKLTLHVLRHPTDTPLFAALALANGLSSRVGVETGGTWITKGRVELSSGHVHHFERRVAGEGNGLDVNVAIALLQELQALTHQTLLEVTVERVSLDVQRKAEVGSSRVLSVDAPGGLRAGAESFVRVRLQPHKGGVEERLLKVRVPAGLPSGPYRLHAVAKKGAADLERDGGLSFEPVDFSSLLASRALAPSDGSLSIYVVTDAAGMRIDGQGLPDLPPSLAGLLSEGGGTSGGALESRVTRLARMDTTGVLVGEAKARVTLERPARPRAERP
jgi:hypothetical protein